MARGLFPELLVLDDPSLYDYGIDWQKIFLRMSQPLDEYGTVDLHEELVREDEDGSPGEESEE